MIALFLKQVYISVFSLNLIYAIKHDPVVEFDNKYPL